jgi:hypothetical protein
MNPKPSKRNHIMIKSLLSTITVLALTVTVAGAALADEGDYYEGVNRDLGVSVDHTATGSIGTQHHKAEQRDSSSPNLNEGDYYQGAVRPN